MKRVLIILAAICFVCLSFFGCKQQESPEPTAAPAEQITQDKSDAEVDVSQYTLRELAEKHNLLVGGACEPYHLEDAEFAKTFAENFNLITPENCMKMESIEPRQGEFDFVKGDKIVDFAEQNDMSVRGHTLVWHNQMPSWITSREDWTREELLDVMETHIKTVVGHYKGRVQIWDVVNEPLEITSYRETLWYEVIGPEYIELALQWAHEADPDAKLYINDYFVEENNAKSTAMYNMVVDLLERGIPLDGVGLQFHINVDDPYDMTSVYTNVKRFVDLGIEVDFTEIDVRINGSVTEDDLQRQAKIYKDLYEMAAGTDGANTVTTWGLSDRYTWVLDQYEGYSSPLLFDISYNEKPALTEVKKALLQDEIKLDYENKLTSLASERVVIAPLEARKMANAPTIDGVVRDGEWDETVKYSFVYNQLNDMDASYDYDDIYGEFTIGYKDGYLYGKIDRQDQKTYTETPDAYLNDCFEVFLEYETFFIQLRSKVGYSFAADSKCEDEIAVWSEDGSVVEFSFKLPISDVEGMVMGFNIALADNDGGGREVQLYPIAGHNRSYMGEDLASIKFQGDTPRPSTSLRIYPAFEVTTKASHPVIDGVNSENEWYGGIDYILGFNQYNELDKTMPEADDFYAEWEMVHYKNVLYGRMEVRDDIIYTDDTDKSKNDHLELSMKIDGEFYTISIEAGSNEAVGDFPYSIDVKWSEDNTCLEYMITFDKELEKERIIPFIICYTDNDGEGVESRMYPISGADKAIDEGNIAELLIN